MPKDVIDYSNTIFYKIYSHNLNIPHFHIGYTTNFVKRKYYHKQMCARGSKKLPIYDIIRNNGLWESWTIVELGKHNCSDIDEVRQKEQFYTENHSLHTPQTSVTTEPNVKSSFFCKFCNFTTSRKSNFTEHLSTTKHQEAMLSNANPATNHKIQQNFGTHFFCQSCNKVYKDNSGLWRHKKKCKQSALHNENPEFDLELEEDAQNIKESLISNNELMMMLIKQNSQLMDVIKNGTNIHTNFHNTNNHNSHNKTFNLQFFLNETCKDAMNIGDFVSSIKPQLADLEATGRLGYVEGISNIILNNLKTLQIHDRPIHCSDSKREILYIKDNNEWTREADDKPILTRAIKFIANENIKKISEWRAEHPDCTKAESKKNDMYLRIVSNSMSGITKEETNKNISKIISNVAKQVVIDKLCKTNK